MGHHTEDDTLETLPGDHDNPKPGSTVYWMTVMFVFFAASAFALHGLTNWAQLNWERQGSKAPGWYYAELDGKQVLTTSGVERLHDAQAKVLEQRVNGDKLHLKSGRIINDGKVVEGVDPEDNTVRVFVKGLPFLTDRDLGKHTLSRAGQVLKFLPSEVDRVVPNKGNPMAVPYEQALRSFLTTHGS